MNSTNHSFAARMRRYRWSAGGVLCCVALLTQTASAYKVKDTIPAGGSLHFHWTDQNGNQINDPWDIDSSVPVDVDITFDTNDWPEFNDASDWSQTVTYADGTSDTYSGNIKGNSPWELHPLNELPDVTWRIPDLAPASGGDPDLTIYAAVNLDIYMNSNPVGFLAGNWQIGDTLSSLGYTISNGVGSDGVQGIWWTTEPISFDPDENGPGFRTDNGLLGPGNPDMLDSGLFSTGIAIISEHDNEDEGCEFAFPPGDFIIDGPCEPQTGPDNCCQCWNEPVPGGATACDVGVFNEQYCLQIMGEDWDHCEFHPNSVCDAQDQCVPDVQTGSFPDGPCTDVLTSTLTMDLDIDDNGSVEETITLDQTTIIRRSSPYTDVDGYRHIDIETLYWHSTGYSEQLQDWVTLTLSDVEQPLSDVVADQQESDYPATLTFVVKYDVAVGDLTVLTEQDGTAIGLGMAEIPPDGSAALTVLKSLVVIGPPAWSATPGLCISNERVNSKCDGVPAASEWGLTILTLLAMTLGTILLARRREKCAARTA